MEQKVRTRFAPSPTGYMHVGNLRTALYAYLTAKHAGGTFILRIEDTDQERYVEGAVDVIYDTCREAGLLWDEGPDVGGPVGPYVQSERMGLFKQYAEQLVADGKAYYCFCTSERLDALHAEQRARGEMTHYDGCCRDLPAEEVRRRLAAGEPYVIRQKIPRTGVTGFDDLVYGHIEVNNSEMDDQILIKSDGMPTYNFANVVDDHLMGITHVIRGSEYLSSTPKYNLLYEAFGWEIPVYIHCPPVMKDAQNKLSKRNGDASYQDLIAKGCLPQAILNYICLLGWSPKGEYAEQEIFSLPELVRIWDPAGISKSPAIFDPLKLRAINAESIRRPSPRGVPPEGRALDRQRRPLPHQQGAAVRQPPAPVRDVQRYPAPDRLFRRPARLRPEPVRQQKAKDHPGLRPGGPHRPGAAALGRGHRLRRPGRPVRRLQGAGRADGAQERLAAVPPGHRPVGQAAHPRRRRGPGLHDGPGQDRPAAAHRHRPAPRRGAGIRA